MFTTHFILFSFLDGATPVPPGEDSIDGFVTHAGVYSFFSWGDEAVGNIIFGQTYNMIHIIHENQLRPTSVTELIVRKRDKKPIICGGDH